MELRKIRLLWILLIIGRIELVQSQCSSPFSNDELTNFCLSYDKTPVSWSDGYNQCLTKSSDAILIEVLTIEQFNALKNLNTDGKDLFWLGANNFASFRDSQWHWLDGTTVDSSIVRWCPTSTYEIAIGTHCAAYNKTSQCITNYLCNKLLPAPCISTTSLTSRQGKSSLISRAVSSSTCANAYAGGYANWWTYTVLLLNWFILLCFTLYLINRFNLNKFLIIITIAVVIVSFMIIIAFAVLWGVQYQDLVQIPLIVVVLGCVASLLFLIMISILVSNRNYVQRWMACMIASIVTIIIELGLMLGLILCIAYCSAYISLVSTSLDKDLIAALLGSITAAVSVIYYYGIIYLLGHVGQDRVHVAGSRDPNQFPLAPTQPIEPRRNENANGANQRTDARRQDKIERATSPVDERILKEFYTDRPKEMHQYQLEGRQYVVYEGKNFADIEPFRKDLTQAMLLQEAQGLREAIARVKSSPHASALTDELQQAESLLNRLK